MENQDYDNAKIDEAIKELEKIDINKLKIYNIDTYEDKLNRILKDDIEILLEIDNKGFYFYRYRFKNN